MKRSPTFVHYPEQFVVLNQFLVVRRTLLLQTPHSVVDVIAVIQNTKVQVATPEYGIELCCDISCGRKQQTTFSINTLNSYTVKYLNSDAT